LSSVRANKDIAYTDRVDFVSVGRLAAPGTSKTESG
jgi:hypothetical protein